MSTAQVLTIETPPPVPVPGGGTAEVHLSISVVRGYHIQANPASHDFLIPLQLKLRGADGVSAGAAVYPKAHRFRLEGMPGDLLTYDGRLEVAVPIEVAPEARPGRHRLRGRLRYQACDDRTCLFPATAAFVVLVDVSPGEGAMIQDRGRMS